MLRGEGRSCLFAWVHKALGAGPIKWCDLISIPFSFFSLHHQWGPNLQK